MTVVSEAAGNPPELLSIIPAIVFQTRIKLSENKFHVDYVNQGAIELLGLDAATFDPAAFAVEDFLALLHPDDLEEQYQRFSDSTRDLSQYHQQCRLLPAGPGVRWLDIVADPEVQSDGWVVWRGVITDITAVKQTEEAFRSGQERFELAVQTGGIGVWEMDFTTRKCVWDARMYEFYGVDPGSFGASMESWVALLDLEDGDRSCREWDAILLSGEVLDREFQINRPDRGPRYMRGLARLIRGPDGTPLRVVGINLDITDRWELQQQLEHMAAHDALTGLPNRVTFERKLEEALRRAQSEGREHVLCFMDLDRFKIVNDSAGHAAGDSFLRQVGYLLQSSVGDENFTARLGGDEFALLLYDCTSARAEHRARELIDAIRAIRLHWEGKVYDIGASIGLTAINAKSPGPMDLMSQADVACYAAKASGRNQILLYGGRNGAAERHHREILVASGIRRAIEAGQLELFAQDILTLDGTKSRSSPSGARHVEILLRMKDASGRVLRPGSFIPAAERYDLMSNLDRWVLENTLILRGEALAAVEGLSISINLSANSLNDPLFWPFLSETLQASGLAPERVSFEITETAMINNLDSAQNFMSVVRAAGHALILDDFGTGLSSFNYLKQFPIDGLKIDGSFIRPMKDSPVDRVIVESINEIAHKLGIRTVAEFVENAETLEIVRAIGIDQAQGYAIGRPLPLDAIIEQHVVRTVSLF
jgi:diguanylate cyclase (GGDEF)-like protein